MAASLGGATSRGWPATVLLFGPALAWSLAAALGLVWTAGDSRAWESLDRHGHPVAGSARCEACHAQAHDSWRRSWHRTMTQEATPGELAGLGPLTVASTAGQGEDDRGQDGVLAPFAGETLDYLGFRATMDRDDHGRPRITVTRESEVVLAATVALTVGSHRYQQYVGFMSREGELWRLPVAWHRAERRWIHMNGAFVEPEGETGSLADYQRHLSRANDNCIFCHNTQPVPGPTADGLGFASEVGELGIGCEACHGPAQAHVARHRNPLRRLLARGEGDGSITHPGRLDPARESAVCGRCHGQRIGRDIAAILREGDDFIPGEDLARVSRPIFADTVIPGVSGLDGRDGSQPFAARFWPDGTP
ncbi:MAG: hypothetical protein KC431_31590, partial [Myxococcales bacterium]|nr:hypothetical protein [Myxococcales bacterium]